MKKKGFLLIEFGAALCLVMISIYFSLSLYAHCFTFFQRSLQMYQKMMVMHHILENVFISPQESIIQRNSDHYRHEIETTRDDFCKNFLHIAVTVYDKDQHKETWYSGVVISNEQ